MGRRILLLAIAGLLFLPLPTTAADRAAPVAVSPGGGAGIALVLGGCPTFSWGGVGGAGAYELVVYALGENGHRAAPILRETIAGSALSWTPALPQCLAPGERYAWSVRAITADGNGLWSDASLFEVAAAPSAAEVEEAVALLRRFAAGRDPDLAAEAGAERTAQPAGNARGVRRSRASSRAERPRQRSSAASGVESAAAETLAAPEPAAAPTLGTASVTVEEQLHWGANSSVFKNGRLFLWGGGFNTALGYSALSSVTSGLSNTAVGYEALGSISTGSGATAIGYYALHYNTQAGNTAVGAYALYSNTSASGNTAVGYRALKSSGINANNNTGVGYRALESNTSGFQNTAIGVRALQAASASNNTAAGFEALSANTGAHNTAHGANALRNNTSGGQNSALGSSVLYNNNTGQMNSAVGYYALYYNYDGSQNAAFGAYALYASTSGSDNVAVGYKALTAATGSSNIAVGSGAGQAVTTGGNNVLIGNAGMAGDSGTMRFGTAGTHASAYVAGVYNVVVAYGTPHPVYVDGNGQLGKSASSRLFKSEIRDMGETSSRVLGLRPVTFRLGDGPPDAPRPVAFGLVAEEVADVFPELVAFDDDGRPQTVRYHLLSSILLNELQKQRREVVAHRWLLALMVIAGLAVALRWRLV